MIIRLLRAVATAAGVLFALASGATAQMPPAQVKVAPVEERELDVRRTFVGSVVPWRTSVVASPIDGLVTEMSVREGDEVLQKVPLAKLETDLLEAQLEAAKAELVALEQLYAELQKGLPKQIEEAQARMQAADAIEQYVRVRLARARKLKANNAISDEAMEEREQAAIAAIHRATESRAAWSVLQLTEAEQYAQANAKVVAQGQVVAQLEIEKQRHTITAPFAGYVSKEHTEQGQWVAKGAPVAELLDLSSVYVEVPVPEEVVSALEKGVTEGDVTIEAVSAKSKKATVVAIVQQGDVRSRSFPVKLKLENTATAGGMLLKAGMLARVSLPVGGKGPALLIPKDAVVLGGRLPVVYVADPMPPGGGPGGPDGAMPGPPPDGIARPVTVVLGPGVGELISVRGELKPGDRVVVEGNERLFPGRPLIVIPEN